MTRYGIISDVHGNLQALQAALAELDRHGVDRHVVAGDLVGYGPNPNECVELVAARGAVCVAGNHDLIALGRLSDERCIPLARDSLRWTRSVLGAGAREFLTALAPRATAPGGVVVAHGALGDAERYVDSRAAAVGQLVRLRAEDPDAQVLVLGHTHRPWAFAAALGPRSTRTPVPLPAAEPILLNPGAVGQSRDVRVRARCLLLDLERRRATFLAVGYDEASCRAALRAAGLPERSMHLRPSPLRVAARALRNRVR